MIIGALDMGSEAEIITGREIDRLVSRLAGEVASSLDLSSLVLVGIRRRGVPLAERLSRELHAGAGGEKPPVGALDITLYRDDLSTVSVQPVVGETFLPVDITGRVILLVDDVLYTGRTIRSALTELVEFGRPSAVKLLVLVDRDHRELPIQPDYTGQFVKSAPSQIVEVRLSETDGEERVLLVQKSLQEK